MADELFMAQRPKRTYPYSARSTMGLAVDFDYAVAELIALAVPFNASVCNHVFIINKVCR